MRSWSKKSLQFFLIFTLMFGWVFSGWPQIWNFPPKIQEASAALNDATVEVLGGGGGGGIVNGTSGGGGGGGEYRRCTETLSVQAYTVTVGVGGTIDTTGETDSTFSGTGITMTADGGNGTSTIAAGSAGTGGVSTNCDTAVANFDGGTPFGGNTGDFGGGAGGGAGYGGKGGNGVVATSTYGGAGGGGAGESGAGGDGATTTAGAAGAGGGGIGGAGRSTDANGFAGAAGTPATYHIVGGGGGGGSGATTARAGGACGAPGAGSGGGEATGAGNGCRGEIRIIYVDAEVAASGGTETTSGIYRIHTFTTSGTFTVSTVASVVDTPTFTDATGTYNNDLSETITVASPASAVICYTTDGSTPGASTPGTCSTGSTYSGAVSITVTGTTLKAIGTKAGYVNSAEQSATYTLQVANPAFGTNGGSFNNDTTSTQTSTTTGAVFCQTVDGTTSPEASSPGTCSVGTTGADATVIATGKTIKVLGTKANYVNSAVQTSSAFTLTVANPAFGTNGGSFNNDTSTTFSSTTTGTVVFCSTLDGSTPAAASPPTCSAGATGASATAIATGTAVKVLGTKANYVNSAVQTSNAFTLTVGAITSSPGAGTYTSTQSVTLSIATTTSAVAHYTTDGSAVSCSSTTYSVAFNVATTTTVKAIGCKTNYVDDTAISDLYTIGLSTAIEIRAQNYTTSVSNITFPAGASGATISAPYNNIDTIAAPQVFGGAGTAKPVITLYNGGGITLTIWYNITTFTNSVVSSENYLVNAKGAACTNASCITGSATFDADTTTGTTIAVGAGNEKDFYLKTTLGTPAGKSGTSTLTILGEGL